LPEKNQSGTCVGPISGFDAWVQRKGRRRPEFLLTGDGSGIDTTIVWLGPGQNFSIPRHRRFSAFREKAE
jgi:hypothetical protein